MRTARRFSGTDGAEAGKRKDANVAVDTEDDAVRKAEVPLSPLEGEVVLLGSERSYFCGEILGKGRCCPACRRQGMSPADGRLVSVFETGHCMA